MDLRWPFLLGTNSVPEFNDHQRDVFCVFSGVGVQRLRSYLNAEGDGVNRMMHLDADGTMYDESEEQEMMQPLTAQANGMVLDEMDEEFGEASELMG
jgi:F-box and leucine-rich repeat protein GRR1